MPFEFSTSARIIFGPGKLNSLGELATGLGDRALVTWDGPQVNSMRLQSILSGNGISWVDIKNNGEPTVDTVSEAIRIGREANVNLVVGLGGGSALDTGKAVAAMLTNPGTLRDYLELLGHGKPLINPPLPLIAIPTTAGTGSEVTKNAVIGSPDDNVKVSLRSPHLLPRIALVDPELSLSMPPHITAFTGMDALTQLIEPFTSNAANPLTDALCVQGLSHIGQSLKRAYDNGVDVHARQGMSLASLFSGMALANAHLGVVHGLAGPLGGELSAHHGELCASLLPNAMEMNIKALQARSPRHPALERYARIAGILTGQTDTTASDAIRWVRDISAHLNIQPLSAYGFTEEKFQGIIDKAKKASSTKGNPITLFDDELRNILMRSL